MPKTLSLLAVLKKVDAKGVKSLSNAQWDTFLASDTEPNEIQEKIAKLEGYEQQGAAYDKTGELIVEDNNAMIERFRKRTGRAQGRESLKVKQSKISVKSFKEKFLDKDEKPVKPDTTGASDLVKVDKPSDFSKPDAEEKNEETEGLKGIREVLNDILGVLRLDFKGDRKQARDAQKEAEKDKREKRESMLEGGVKKAVGGIGKSIGAMVKPFQSIWDKIIDFLKFTLINVLFNKTLKWFDDPKNQEKAKRIGKFLKDFAPVLTTAALLFLTPLGALLNGVVGLLTAIIPKLVMAIAANPWAAAALVGTGLAVWGVSKLASGLGGDKEGENLAEAQNQSSEQLQEEGMDAGDAEVLSQSVTTENVDRMTQGDTNLRSNTNMLQTGRDDPLGGNNMGRFNEGGLVQSNQSSNVQNYNEGGLVQSTQSSNVQNYNEGGLVQHYNEGGSVTVIDTPKSAQNFVQNFNEGGEVQGFNKGGEVPGSGNKDTVPAMLTPGEFVMSKGAVQKYGSDTLEGMNAATGGSGSQKNDTVPSMLTPGEFVVSAPAVQRYGVKTLESMNLKGGGNNKPEVRVGANKGGLINNYNTTLMKYKGGGVVEDSIGENVSQDIIEIIQKTSHNIISLVESSMDEVDNISTSDKKMEPVDIPVSTGSSKTITLPTIPKQTPEMSQKKSNNEIPEFRIPIVSSQRSMVIASLGIQDLIGG